MRCAMPSIRESPTDEPARHRPIRAAAPGGGGGEGGGAEGRPGGRGAAGPSGARGGGVGDLLLKVKELGVRFEGKQVVRGLNFAIAAGEKLAMVGESGSGKTITALSLLRLAGAAACTGQALLQGRGDLLAMPEREMQGVRGGDIAMVFQEPMSALNPLMTIGRQIA